MAKTVAYFDIDGVLNAIPFERVWVGSEEDRTSRDILPLYEPKNWEIVRLQPDLTTHFDINREEQVTMDKNDTPKTFTLRFSDELIQRINVLIEDDFIDFKWLTTWRDQAHVAAEAFGLPTNLPWIQWYQRGMSDYQQVGKGDAIERLATEGEARRFLWVDDVATKWHANYPDTTRLENDPLYDKYYRFGSKDRLVLQTDARFGISREEMQAIEDFV